MNNSQGPDLLVEMKGYLADPLKIHAKPHLWAPTAQVPPGGLRELRAGGRLPDDTCLLTQPVSGVLFSAADASTGSHFLQSPGHVGFSVFILFQSSSSKSLLLPIMGRVLRQLKLKIQSIAFARFFFKSDGQVTDCGLDRFKVTLSCHLSSALPSLLLGLSRGC